MPAEPLITRRQFAGAAAAAAGAALVAPRRAAFAADGRPPALRAGAAEAVVTPDAHGTFLIGPMKPSTGVHDDLYARALVLDDGTTQVAVLTVDYLGFDVAYNGVLIDAVAAATGIPGGHVMINCSHTHSAPLTAPWGPWEKAHDKPFHRLLPRRLAEVALRAKQNLGPARLSHRREPAQVGFNRRLPSDGRIVMAVNPAGPVLPWADVLAVRPADAGAGAEPIAVLFSHAAHPVIVHATSTLISADYPGFAVAALKESVGRECVHLFAQGCGGNINAFPLKGGLDAARAAGRELGQAVHRAVVGGQGVEVGGALRVASADLRLPLQAPPPADEVRRQIEAERDPDRKARLADLLAAAPAPRTVPCPIRAFAVGDQLCVLGFPHDTFAEYHLHAERASPFARNMVFGYTNGLECYAGTAADYRLGDRGGYETAPRGAAFMFESRLPLAPEAEALIRDAAAKVLAELRRA